MWLPDRSRQLTPRGSSSSNNSSGNIAFIAVGIAIIALLIAVTISYIVLRRLRAQNRKPTLIPTSFLKQRWYSWAPRSKYGQVSANDRSRNLSTANTSYDAASNEGAAGDTAIAAGVNRNTSVRSVMTLPPYSQAPKETEQVIGREGERGGMDTVVEFPEHVDEEETRREEEMESLYQIREARRREVAEREERRQERRIARSTGDWATLERLTRESRARADAARLGSAAANASITNVSAATLLAEHQSRGRDRRTSAVTYASVGHVRHDGTRLRANSDESERGGLLDGAAPMGGEGDVHTRNRAASGASSLHSTIPRPHFRDRSASSILSISTTASDLEAHAAARPTPPSTRDGGTSIGEPGSASGSDPTGTGTSDSSPTANRFTPAASSGSDDNGDTHVSGPGGSHPPTYEQLEWGDAPAYESPVSPVQNRVDFPANSINDVLTAQAVPSGATSASTTQRHLLPSRIPSQAPRLPSLEVVPSINVEGATEPNTPATTPGMGSMEFGHEH